MTDNEKINSIDYKGDGTAEDIMRWALTKYHPRIAIATNLEDAVLIHMAVQINPDVCVFSIDTGRLPEETYMCAEEIMRRLGVRIKWYFPKNELVEKLETEKGLYSFRKSLADRKECCFIRKVEPLNRALAGLDAWITGLRRDQSVTRQSLQKIEIDEAHGNILKINPLADWRDVDIREYTKKILTSV
jgi:phosphoadenosine phosphosulfate reductase